MSKEKKAKKARTPNIPMYTGPVEQTTTTRGSGGGGGTVSVSSPASTVTARTPGRTEVIQADYTYVISDLKRIGLLAGSLIVVIVALSFFIK